MRKTLFFGVLGILASILPVGCTPLSEEDEVFYDALVYGTAKEVEDLLASGHNPDFVNPPLAQKWQHSNPLWKISGDYERTEILIRYGADVTKRPYIAKILFAHCLSTKLSEQMEKNYFQGAHTTTEEEAYKIVSLYLQNGADPNLKYISTQVLFPSTDATYRKAYKKNGVSAVNCAIRLNLFSVVDLLLENGAVLDDQTLKWAQTATEWSGGNTEMETKIRVLLDSRS